MKLNRNKISLVHRVISFLLAAYLLNFSIDSRDAHPDAVVEDLSFNDIESVYELLAEDVVGIENAVEEHDERDQEEGGSFEFKKVFFQVTISKIQVKTAYYMYSIHFRIDYAERLSVRSPDINSPPPKA